MFFCDSSPRRGQENLYKTQRYKLLFETFYTFLRLEIYRNTFAYIEFTKTKVFVILNNIFDGSHFKSFTENPYKTKIAWFLL